MGGRQWNYFSGAIDVVAHELAHGVTDYTSDLVYRNESGALNEAFSDILGTSAEFYYQQAGTGYLKADYLLGEDLTAPSAAFRSMADPQAYGDPDHYAKRYIGVEDNGGVHHNSGIANHAFYLAIEGGVNRTSGLSVQGVGAANRETIERVFYRAFTQLLPANATFSMARAATLQAARDLYGAGGGAERAVGQAWTAVGVS
jgi:thermolysin